eukprot:627190_1
MSSNADVCKHTGYGLGHSMKMAVIWNYGDSQIDMNAFALRKDTSKQNVAYYGSYEWHRLAPYNFCHRMPSWISWVCDIHQYSNCMLVILQFVSRWFVWLCCFTMTSSLPKNF